MKFTYPTEPERKEMNLINRDRNPQELNKITNVNKDLQKLLGSLKKGEIRREDLAPEVLKELQTLLLETQLDNA